MIFPEFHDMMLHNAVLVGAGRRWGGFYLCPMPPIPKAGDDPMPAIQTIAYRKILNSHVRFTPEFIVQFENGGIGTGAAPQGETISIYEPASHHIHLQASYNHRTYVVAATRTTQATFTLM